MASLHDLNPIETKAGAMKAVLLFCADGPLVGTTPFFLLLLPVAASEGGVLSLLAISSILGFFYGAIPAVLAGALFVMVVRTIVRKRSWILGQEGACWSWRRRGGLVVLDHRHPA